MQKSIEKFYDLLKTDKNVQKELLNEKDKFKGDISKDNLKEIAKEIILPVALKHNFDLTVDDIVDYEMKNQTELDLSKLEDVSGGFGINPKIASTALLLLTVGSGIMSTTGSQFASAEEGTAPPSSSVTEAVTQLPLAPSPTPPPPPPPSPALMPVAPPPPPPVPVVSEKNATKPLGRNPLLEQIEGGFKLKKTRKETPEEKAARREREEEEERLRISKMSVKERLTHMAEKESNYTSTQKGSSQTKRDFSKKVELDINQFNTPQLLGFVKTNVDITLPDYIEKIPSTANIESNQTAKKLLVDINETLSLINESNTKILNLYKEARKNGEKSLITNRDTIRSLKDSYEKLQNHYKVISKKYSNLGFDPASSLHNMPESPLPLPTVVEADGITFSYSEDQGSLTVKSKPGKKVVLSLEILKQLGIKDKPFIVEKDIDLDENASKLLTLKFDKDHGGRYEKRPGSPSIEDVYEAMNSDDESDLDKVLKPLSSYSPILVTYNSAPVKIEASKPVETATINWKKNTDGKIVNSQGSATFDPSTGLLEVKGSPIVLELKDINSLESLSSKNISNIQCKQKGKIVLGQSLRNAGWHDTTGIFFGNYSFSKYDEVETTDTADVSIYKYGNDIYINDERDDKSTPINLTQKDLDKVSELGAKKIWSRSKIVLADGISDWAKNNSLRYYGFIKN